MSGDLQTIKTLAVSLHGQRIGLINRFAGDRQLFAFETDYVEDRDRPTLSLSFKGEGSDLVTTPRSYSANAPPFFSNLLPEGHLRTYLANQAGVKPEREFFLLAALGADLPGAVVVTPLDHRAQEVSLLGTQPADVHDHTEDPVLRFSLAGVQLKFSAVMEATGGLTVPATGLGGSWIVKLPSAQYSAVPENEFVMLELAEATGIPVPKHRLVPVGEIAGLPSDAASLAGSALAVERFDRGPAGERIHMEDFAQVFGVFPDDKYRKHSYANIASVLWAETGEEGTWEFLRRLAFSVVIGNGDMHLKNWSLLYPDGRTPQLAPAYDFVSTIPYIAGEELALGFGGSRRLTEITKDQVRRFADTAGLPVNPAWEIVRDTVQRTAEEWCSCDARRHLQAGILERVDLQITSVADALRK